MRSGRTLFGKPSLSNVLAGCYEQSVLGPRVNEISRSSLVLILRGIGGSPLVAIDDSTRFGCSRTSSARRSITWDMFQNQQTSLSGWRLGVTTACRRDSLILPTRSLLLPTSRFRYVPRRTMLASSL